MCQRPRSRARKPRCGPSTSGLPLPRCHRRSKPRPHPTLLRVLAHMKVLGDPTRWETATTYESLALALMDAAWSIGVRYAGVLNVLERYRGARRREGGDPDHDTPANLVAFIAFGQRPDAFGVTVDNRQRTSSRSGDPQGRSRTTRGPAARRRGHPYARRPRCGHARALGRAATPLDGDHRTGLRPLVGLLPHAGGPPRRQGDRVVVSSPTSWVSTSTRSPSERRTPSSPTRRAARGGHQPAGLRDLASPERQQAGLIPSLALSPIRG